MAISKIRTYLRNTIVQAIVWRISVELTDADTHTYTLANAQSHIHTHTQTHTHTQILLENKHL